MSARISRAFGAFLLGVVLASCGDSDPVQPVPSAPPPGEPLLLVVNGLAETLTTAGLDSAFVNVTALLLGDAPQDIVVGPDGRLAAVVNSGSNSVWVLEVGDSLRVRHRVDLGAGANPWAAAIGADGTAWVSLLLAGEVERLDLAAGQPLGRTAVGTAPEGILIAPPYVVVAVSNYATEPGGEVRFGPGSVAVLDEGTGSLLRSVPVGLNPQALARAPDGRLHVVCTGNFGQVPSVGGVVYVLDAAAEAVVDSLPIGGSPGAIAITGGGIAYVTGNDGALLAYDTQRLEMIAPRNAPILELPGLFDLALEEERERLFVAGFDDDLVLILDTAADTLLGAVAVGDGPVSIAVRP